MSKSLTEFMREARERTQAQLNLLKRRLNTPKTPFGLKEDKPTKK